MNSMYTCLDITSFSVLKASPKITAQSLPSFPQIFWTINPILEIRLCQNFDQKKKRKKKKKRSVVSWYCWSRAVWFCLLPFELRDEQADLHESTGGGRDRKRQKQRQTERERVCMEEENRKDRLCGGRLVSQTQPKVLDASWENRLIQRLSNTGTCSCMSTDFQLPSKPAAGFLKLLIPGIRRMD